MGKKFIPFGVIYSGVLLAAAVLFYCVVSLYDIPHFGCPFKIITGIPCPTCGATRMSYAFLNFHVFKAIYYNPMLSFILLGIPLWGLHDILVVFDKITPITIPRSWFRWGGLIIFLLNWAYLIIMKI